MWHHYEHVASDITEADETTSALTTKLTRSENFAHIHKDLKSLLMDPSSVLVATVGQALGEPAVLYKEKINFKYPGGQGYKGESGISMSVVSLLSSFSFSCYPLKDFL